jgi:toxin HigB-1
MPELIFTDSYEKRARKFFKKHPELAKPYGKVLKLLAANPWHPSLRLHKLHGNLAGIYSASINLSYRINLQFIVKDDAIVPIDIGSHDDIY